jgi:hypothetical protein
MAVGPEIAFLQLQQDTLRVEVGSPLVDGRFYVPHRARNRVYPPGATEATNSWTNELTLGDSAGVPVMRWVTRGEQQTPNGVVPTYELYQTYNAITLAPMAYLLRSANGGVTQLSINGKHVRGEQRPANGTPTQIDRTVARIGYFSGASDLVPPAANMRPGMVIVAPVWHPMQTEVKEVIFTIVGEVDVEVEGETVRAWKVEERNYADKVLTVTWYMTEQSPYMVLAEIPVEGGIQRMTGVDLGNQADIRSRGSGRWAASALSMTRSHGGRVVRTGNASITNCAIRLNDCSPSDPPEWPAFFAYRIANHELSPGRDPGP